jgi:acyl-homoserine-lactone acylase
LVLTTELRERGPRARGILTYSQASDPTSPWYSNMTKLFSKKRWVDLRFTARQLARDTGARRTSVPGAVAP